MDLIGKIKPFDVVAGALSAPGPRARRLVHPTFGKSVWGILVLLLALSSGGLFYIVWIYANALRDPRFLDGWMLAGGMSLQLLFHIAIKTGRLPSKSAAHWRKAHLLIGLLLVSAFISHCDFGLPDTELEWVLWACFVMVTLSGIFSAYLAWAFECKRAGARMTRERISTRRAELAIEAKATVSKIDATAAAIGLPAPAYDAWIQELYTVHLEYFFQAPRNTAAHLVSSQLPLKHLTDEIDSLTQYVDKPGQEKLATLKTLVVEKDGLDAARVNLTLTTAWLFVHIPLTYALIVLTPLHILVVYAFSSGAW